MKVIAYLRKADSSGRQASKLQRFPQSGELFFNQISDGMLGGASETPANSLAGLGWHPERWQGDPCLDHFASECERADCRRRDRLTMSGVLRLYKTRKGKAVAHRLWRCF